MKIDKNNILISKIINSLETKNTIHIVILIIITLIVSIPMLNSSLSVLFDKGIQNIARTYGTDESIKEGIILGNIIPKFSNGFGYSWNLFYGFLTPFLIILLK